MIYSKVLQSRDVFNDDISNGLIDIINPIDNDIISLQFNFNDNVNFTVSFKLKKVVTSFNYISFDIIDYKPRLLNIHLDEVFSISIINETYFDDIESSLISSYNLSYDNLSREELNGFFEYVSNFHNCFSVSLVAYSLVLPSYVDIYEDYSTPKITSNVKYSSYNDMFSWLSYQNNTLQETTQELLNNLLSKLDTLDNLNILSQADFSPLLSLSEFSNLVGDLNPSIANLANGINGIDDNMAKFLPVREKYGEVVEPIITTRLTVSLIDYSNITINRTGDKNSIIRIFNNRNELIKKVYDIDYYHVIDFVGYQDIIIEYDKNQYTIDKAN